MKKILKFIAGVAILGLVIMLLINAVIEPWVGKKIETEFEKTNSGCSIEIEKINLSLISSGLELKNITFKPKLVDGEMRVLSGDIASIKLKGINFFKILFEKDIEIRELNISKSNLTGSFPFSGKESQPIVSPVKIRIDELIFEKTDLTITNTSNAQAFTVKKGFLKVYEIQFNKSDTLSGSVISHFDFDATEISMVSTDSMYSFKALNIQYSATSNTLMMDSFMINPNFEDYDFTSRREFQTDRIEADFSNIFVYHFSAADYFGSQRFVSSYIEIRKMDLSIFRDNRKKFKHVVKPTFQEVIYNYPGLLNIDSLNVLSGNITYTEHAEKANEPGMISFNEIEAKFSKISNDTIYKTDTAFLELHTKAKLMGKGDLAISLKSRIFDANNTFSVDGTLSGMEASDLNLMLEKNAFVYATSGKIDAMSFNFTANNSKATGQTTLLYHDLYLAVKNKRTDDTTAFVQRLVSIIANIKVLDSNPLPGDTARVGIVEYQRDPERFLFNYCFKSIMTGIKSNLDRNPGRKQK
jgi:hypothetical protein